MNPLINKRKVDCLSTLSAKSNKRFFATPDSLKSIYYRQIKYDQENAAFHNERFNTNNQDDRHCKKNTKVQFKHQSENTTLNRFYTPDDVANAWISEHEMAISSDAILLEVQATRYFDVCMRGLEQFQNTAAIVQRGIDIRQSIRMASKECDGINKAAALSLALSADDVNVAHEVASVDACVAKQIHGVPVEPYYCKDDGVNQLVLMNMGATRNVPLPVTGKYCLFSHRRQTKRMCYDVATF